MVKLFALGRAANPVDLAGESCSKSFDGLDTVLVDEVVASLDIGLSRAVDRILDILNDHVGKIIVIGKDIRDQDESGLANVAGDSRPEDVLLLADSDGGAHISGGIRIGEEALSDLGPTFLNAYGYQ